MLDKVFSLLVAVNRPFCSGGVVVVLLKTDDGQKSRENVLVIH